MQLSDSLEAKVDPDALLVERVQRGDKRAFDLLVLKYQHKVVHLIMRFVHDLHEAQDVAQDTFVRAYRAIGNFRGDSQFYTWLYRIAVNTAKNQLVSLGRRPPTDGQSRRRPEPRFLGRRAISGRDAQTRN